MESKKDGKRKKDERDNDDAKHRDKKSKRNRSRSSSPSKTRDQESRRKRRRTRSRSPKDIPVKQEKRSEPLKDTQAKNEPARKVKETDMVNTRTGGAYIPPARLRMMQAQITDKSSVAYQRLAWEALKKSIHGHINKINVGNIGIIIKELLKENIVRGRGLLCRSVIQAQAASPTFTNVYAALVAAVNSRFPNIGELLLKRLVIQFKRGFKRNDKPTCISYASFIAHLVNQRVAHEILALELLTLLVETPTDDSVEVSIAFLKECGQKLTEVSSKGVNAIFEMLRNILHEGQLDKRVQYMIEVMFQVWKDGFKDHPALIEELELVPEEEQFTHLLMLDDATDPQDILNVFKFDDKYEENEQKYKTLSKEILGSDAESGDDGGSDESGSEESDDDDEESGAQKGVTIIDNTETNLVALRRTIYLTINSSLDFEECAHKLMKMELKPGQEVELCHMFLDCCAEQRTYEKFYGLLAQRFCNINRIYIGPFEEIFKDSYSTAHRLDTNRLRNVSKFFAHLLFTDSISWEVLECVRLNEEDTTSSSRIYIKILFQELAEYMGLKKLNDRLKDPTLQLAFGGVFPRDNPKNTRFSINFFTSIGLGGLTDELREHLKQMPKNVPPPPEINLDSESSSDSSSSSSSSSSDSSSSESSDSENEGSTNKNENKKKNSNKEREAPATDETAKSKGAERWGHDGFYDTYGKDSRRNERDKDKFVVPRNPPRRPEQRNGDERNRSDKNDEDSRNKRHDNSNRREREHRGNRLDEEDRRHKDEEQRRYEKHTSDDRRKNVNERDSGYESRSRREIDDGRRDKDYRREDKTERDKNEYRKERYIEKRNDKEYDSGKQDRKGKAEHGQLILHRDKENKENADKTKEHKQNKNKNKATEETDEQSSEEDADSRKYDRKSKDKHDQSKAQRTKEKEYVEDKPKDRKHKSKKKSNQKSDGEISSEEDTDSRTQNIKGRDEHELRSKRDKENREHPEEKTKERKHKNKKKGTESEQSSDEDSDDHKRDKDKRKKRKKDKKNRGDDGWDIRGVSARREVAERFWDMKESSRIRRCETEERSPERSERSKDRRRDR